MKKYKHEFYTENIKDDIRVIIKIPMGKEGYIAFRMKIDGEEYGDIIFYSINTNLCQQMRALVLTKHMIIEDLNRIKKDNNEKI